MDNKTFIDKIFTIILIIYPLLNVYQGPSSILALSGLLMIIVLAGLFITKPSYYKLRKNDIIYYFFGFAYFCLILALISSLLTQKYDLIKIFGRFGLLNFFIVVLFVSKSAFDFKLALNLIRIVSLLACLSLFIQLAAYYVFNITYHAYIPFLTLQEGLELSINNLIIEDYLYISIYRPMTIFGEPSHFAYYIILSLAVLLFIDEGMQQISKIFLAFIYSSALVLSTSGAGAYSMLIVWLFYLIKRKKFIPVILVSAIMITFIFYATNEYLGYGFSRLTTSSGRIFSFIKYLVDMDFELQLIGCGMGNQTVYFKEIIEESVSSFLSGFGRIIVESGYIGLCTFIAIIVKFYNNTEKDMKIFIILFIILNAIESTVFSMYLASYLIWPLYYNKSAFIKYKTKSIGGS